MEKSHLAKLLHRRHMREEGLEPSRALAHWNLNPARLPIPPLSQPEIAPPFDNLFILGGQRKPADSVKDMAIAIDTDAALTCPQH